MKKKLSKLAGNGEDHFETKLVGEIPVDSGQIWISFPQEGIRFSTNCNATMTNVTAITAFWG